jgi:hypothetical protein
MIEGQSDRELEKDEYGGFSWFRDCLSWQRLRRGRPVADAARRVVPQLGRMLATSQRRSIWRAERPPFPRACSFSVHSLSPLYLTPWQTSGAAMDAAAKLYGHCRSPTSALLVPQSSATSSSPARAAPSALFSRSELSPEFVTTVAVRRALGCARGQTITGHHGASHDCQRVRGDPKVPPRHFPDADVPPSGRNREHRRPPAPSLF